MTKKDHTFFPAIGVGESNTYDTDDDNILGKP